MSFVHLNAHSSYSLLEGMPSVKALAKQAAKLNMPALGLTETNNVFSAVDMSKQFAEEGVQPILGAQLGLCVDPEHYTHTPGFITLLVQNKEGWQNLAWLATKASKNKGRFDTTQITLDDLEQKSSGLILLAGGGRFGALTQQLSKQGEQEAKKLLERLAQSFKDRTYIELQRHKLIEEKNAEAFFLDVAYDKGLPLVATNDSRFLEPKHERAFDALLCIGEGVTVEESNRRHFNADYAFKTAEQMCTLFSDVPEATQNTLAIAQRCGHLLDWVSPQKMFMPQWIKEENDPDVAEILRLQSEEGLDECMEKYVYPDCADEAAKQTAKKEYDERLAFELSVINKMGFAGYFLITGDFIQWAKDNNIPVGPGRGSGAGSLVAWALKITDLDPIKWNLYFERFLNPERVSLPDFDVDFCQDRREEVIDYVRNKYGHDAVSQIITFGTLKAKACIRDVGRVLNMSYGQVGQIAGFVPEVPNPPSIKEVLDSEERFKELYDRDEDVKRLIDIAMQLEGCFRHASTHAAGVIIADRSITDIAPMYYDDPEGMPATQFSMYDAEYAGLVKFDFLGLKTLTVIQQAVEMINVNRPEKLDISRIPIDDDDTYKMVALGHNVGVFQVESAGMSDLAKKLAVKNMHELAAVVCLFRPGPMALIDDFVACHHGKKEVVYPHPCLEDLLKTTNGIAIYQEQVMGMAQEMADYSLGEADLLRRAMGKKKIDEMKRHRAIFVERSVAKQGISENKANEIFDTMADFAGYGFNIAHTFAYTLISYQTAYLKCHYPLEFMAASMSLDRGNSDKVLKFKGELDRMGVSLLPPCINHSDRLFTVEGDAIRFALTAIKGAGDEAMKALVKERVENGAYKDIFDFLKRQASGSINKKAVEVLIKSGAMDCLGVERSLLFHNMEKLLGYMLHCQEEKNSNQIGLFGGGGESSDADKPQLEESNAWDSFEKLGHEQQVFGFYLSAHPLESYIDELNKMSSVQPIKMIEEMAMKGLESMSIAGVIHSKRVRKTRTGNRMATIVVSDATGQAELAVFPEAFDKYYDVIDRPEPMLFGLQISYDGERVGMNVRSISLLDDHISHNSTLKIKVQNLDMLKEIQSIIVEQKDGPTHCELYYTLPEGKHITVRLGRKVALGRRAMAQLESLRDVQIEA